MATKGLLRGRKFNGRHQTIIPDAEEFVRKAKSLEAVTKITIGMIIPVPVGPVHTKIVEDRHALRIKYRGKDAIQEFFIYGKDLSAVKSLLEKNQSSRKHNGN